MPLLGQGTMTFWNDIEGDAADFNRWHSFEHMPERVGIPGFRRGRRCAAVAGGPEYFVMYETDGAATLTSPAYLERLNNPTPWTSRNQRRFRNSNRTLAAVSASFGHGVGAAQMTILLAPEAGREAQLRRHLHATLGGLVGAHAALGAHLLEADAAASRIETAEKALRDRPDEVADWVLVIEALEQEALLACRAGALADAALVAAGARAVENAARYRLLHVLHAEDLA